MIRLALALLLAVTPALASVGDATSGHTNEIVCDASGSALDGLCDSGGCTIAIWIYINDLPASGSDVAFEKDWNNSIGWRNNGRTNRWIGCATTNGNAECPAGTLQDTTPQWWFLCMPMSSGGVVEYYIGDLVTPATQCYDGSAYQTKTDCTGTVVDDSSYDLTILNDTTQSNGAAAQVHYFAYYSWALTLGQCRALQWASSPQEQTSSGAGAAVALIPWTTADVHDLSGNSISCSATLSNSAPAPVPMGGN